MSFETYNGVFSVDAVQQLPVAYLARASRAQVALFDTLTVAAGDVNITRTHVATGQSNKRDVRKRSKRLIVYGTGQINSGQILICADNARTETYPYVPVNLAGLYTNYRELITQGTSGLTGIVFDITLVLFGIGIEVNEVMIDFTEIG